jgi:hypothetical protein
MNDTLGYIEISQESLDRVAAIEKAVKAASDLTHLDGCDPYQVEVWRERRFEFGPFRLGRYAWRRDVVYLGAHDVEGDQSLPYPVTHRFDSRDDALADAIDAAIYIHGHDCPVTPDGRPELPLVVYVAGKTVIDERVQS